MEHKEQDGFVRIADDVVAVIAGIAATETEGIAGMSGGITEELARRVSGKNASRGVNVEVGEVEAAIDLRVIVQYGAKIHEVCRELQYNVKQAVESMTGLKVVEVNVKVEGVALQDEGKKAPEDVEQRVK
ncbi:Asp23/Gls24 family envelope stress response protein [Numidum massiliense]|uniref:Asp23/Gls24 family envelope stress response protein n=1 Tax=Numidum massiliense TaxID=1522315 RepID=UPI0006D55788|nr:Asp23/Gls24 family envelope stress response protein [Numidum massiliense]